MEAWLWTYVEESAVVWAGTVWSDVKKAKKPFIDSWQRKRARDNSSDFSRCVRSGVAGQGRCRGKLLILNTWLTWAGLMEWTPRVDVWLTVWAEKFGLALDFEGAPLLNEWSYRPQNGLIFYTFCQNSSICTSIFWYLFLFRSSAPSKSIALWFLCLPR